MFQRGEGDGPLSLGMLVDAQTIDVGTRPRPEATVEVVSHAQRPQHPASKTAVSRQMVNTLRKQRCGESARFSRPNIANRSTSDRVIGSRDAILKVSALGRWDEGVIPAVTPLGIDCRIR